FVGRLIQSQITNLESLFLLLLLLRILVLLLFHPLFLALLQDGLEAARQLRFFAGVAGPVVAPSAKRLGKALDAPHSLWLGVRVPVAVSIADFAHQTGHGVSN